MGKLGDIKKRMIAERGFVCEGCGNDDPHILHAAHVFVNFDKRFQKHTDSEENLALACGVCHGFDKPSDPNHRKIDQPSFRESFMQTQIDRYGREHMRKYLLDYPPRKKLGSEWQQAALLLAMSNDA